MDGKSCSCFKILRAEAALMPLAAWLPEACGEHGCAWVTGTRFQLWSAEHAGWRRRMEGWRDAAQVCNCHRSLP